MLKIGLIGLLAVFLALPLKKEHSEFGMLIGLATGLVIFLYALAQIHVITSFLGDVMNYLPIDETYLVPLMKMLGLTYVADFVSSICKEAGYGSIASELEIFAKLTIIALSIPELKYLLEVLDGFLV